MTYQITKGVVKVTVCDEHLLVVKHLNAAGAYIWGKLENAVPAEQIAESIAADYGISEKDARASLQTFLQTLCDAGYIRPES